MHCIYIANITHRHCTPSMLYPHAKFHVSIFCSSRYITSCDIFHL